MTNESPQGTPIHVLFVDDEEEIVRLAARLLDRRGFMTTGHVDPSEALKEFGAAPDRFDIVAADTFMPAMSGFELALQLRSIRPGIPILLMSGALGAEETERGRALGVHEFLSKPYSAEQLAAAVTRALRDA